MLWWGLDVVYIIDKESGVASVSFAVCLLFPGVKRFVNDEE